MLSLKKLIKILKALADENRLRIVSLLKFKQDLCVCEITVIIGLSQPTISSHLKKLEEAGIVSFSKDGPWVNYSLNKEMEAEVGNLINSISHAVHADKKIKSDILKVSKVCREDICKK
jgi:ArsR family transcriptional regulator